MFDRLGRFVGRCWWLILPAWAAACALSIGAPKLSQVGVDDSVDFLSRDADAVQARRLLQRAFPKDVYQSSAAVVVRHEQGLGLEHFDLVDRLAIAIRRLAQTPLYHLPIGQERTPPPFAAPPRALRATVTSQPAPGRTGTARYCWLYVHQDHGRVIGRSECAPATPEVTVRDTAVLLTDLPDSPDPQVTHKEIYRTKAGDPTKFYRLAVLPRGTDSFLDRTPDLQMEAEPGLFVPFIAKVTDYSDVIVGQRFYVSADGKATIIQIAMDSYWLATQTLVTCRHIRGLVRETVERWKQDLRQRWDREGRPADDRHALDVQVCTTGYAPVGQDYIDEAASSVFNTQNATYVMVVAILLLVYRAPLLALIPLVTVAVAVSCSWAVLAELALLAEALHLEFKVINITDIFVIVILFGAGTDYCLFLIARAREALEAGQPAGAAVAEAVGRVGGALAASAGTVICGLGMMVFAEFAKYRYTGPAVAVSLAVGLAAALTLAPSLLCLLGRSAFWTPLDRRTWARVRGWLGGRGVEAGATDRRPGLWERIAEGLVARPGTILAVCLAIMLPLAVFGFEVEVTYDLLEELPRHTEAVRGIDLIRQHFPIGEMDPIKLLLEDTRQRIDFNEGPVQEAVAALSDELAAFPGVARVRSLSRPLGDPIPVVTSTRPAEALPLVGGISRVLTDLADRAQKVKQRYYVSTEGPLAGRVTRIDIVLDENPFSIQAMHRLEALRRLVARHVERPDSPLHGVRFSFAGATGGTNDLRKVTESDEQRIRVFVTAGIFVILVLLIRRVGVSLYLILSVIFSYFVTLGVTRLVFTELLGQPGLHWTVTFFLFVLLIAVGEDYNIFLMARVAEESRRHGTVEGLRLAVARTGAIITSCGIIMAGTFASMLTATLSALVQLGFALAFGVLLDTFVVRPILVPTFLLLLYRWTGRNSC